MRIASPKPPPIDTQRLAAQYLGDDAVGRELGSLISHVSDYLENNPTPARRRARKADLEAAAKAAVRLQKALSRLDGRTKVAAIDAGLAQPPANAARGEIDILAHSHLRRIAEIEGFDGTLATVGRGLARLADGVTVPTEPGHPERHDAIKLGLEWLHGLWWRYRRCHPTASFNAGAFGALASDLFTPAPIGLTRGAVREAVVDYVRSAPNFGQQADNEGDTAPPG